MITPVLIFDEKVYARTIRRVLLNVGVGVDIFMDTAADRALGSAMYTIKERFEAEGPPQWKELAPLTRRLRTVLGYEPAHPILVRTGELRDSLIDYNHPLNIHRIRDLVKGPSGVLGTKDPRFLDLQWGTTLEGGNIPARWMWPGLGSQEEIDMMVGMESVLIALLWETSSYRENKEIVNG